MHLVYVHSWVCYCYVCFLTFRQKLENHLKKWYGLPEHTDLVRDEMSDTEMEKEKDADKKPKKKWKKKEAT